MDASILVVGANDATAVVPSTLVSQIEALMDVHQISEATALVTRYSETRGHTSGVDEQILYAYQRIGFQCLSETLFEQAGECLFNGELDPRILVSFFPDLRGSLFNENETVDVFLGVAEHIPQKSSIEDIIRNYSPHLPPNTRTAPPTTELRRIFLTNADNMLTTFLRKYRTKRLMEQMQAAQQQTLKQEKLKTDPLDVVIDTVLAKLLARSEKTAELYALLHEPNQVSLSELEPVLIQTGQYNALCMLFREKGEHDKLLSVWAKIASGEWSDDDIPDPIGDILSLLDHLRERTLIQKWGLWLIKRDPERGLKLLMTGRRTRDKQDDLSLLEQIEEAHPEAGERFLEYLIINRRSNSPALHTKLAISCVDQLLASLDDDAVLKLWRAKASSWASSKKDTTSTFLTSFAATTPDSPHKRARLKAILVLQGSSVYDTPLVRARFLGSEMATRVLALEKAILEGKSGEHQAALSTLVHSLHDPVSAETYCALGGDVVPAKTAQLIGEQYELKEWSNILFPVSLARQKVVNEHLKRQLLKLLLQVYINDSEGSRDRAAHLISSQAINLDTIDVISTVPSEWPLCLMDSFLARSFRRIVHAKLEGQIVKNISAGQNLEIVAESWAPLHEHGGLVEEAVEGDDGDDEGKAELITSEKILLPGQEPAVHEFHVDEKAAMAEDTLV